MAHDHWQQLCTLLTLLDDPRNDVFLHIDAKADITRFTPPRLKYVNIQYCSRVDVRWGHVSQIEAELNLFEFACQTEHSYYHLISGVDLPIHSQDYIHDFFENKKLEYIGFSENFKDAWQRTHFRTLLPRYQRPHSRLLHGLLSGLRNIFYLLQQATGMQVHQPDITFYKGCNWVSVTHDFATELMQHREQFLCMYRYGSCCDEVYKQTYAKNSNFKDKVYLSPTGENGSSLREVDWNRGFPYVWRKEDYEYLVNNSNIFARKFDDNIDATIIEMIAGHVRGNNASE